VDAYTLLARAVQNHLKSEEPEESVPETEKIVKAFKMM